MPASITHMLISKRVRDSLRQIPEMANFVNAVLDKHSQYMELGSLGPDLPYFGSWKSLVNPNRPMGVDPWSYQLHSKSPNLFPLLMMEIICKESDPKVDGWEDRDNLKVAYLCGFLTHMAADQTIHPVVNAVAGPYYFKRDASSDAESAAPISYCCKLVTVHRPNKLRGHNNHRSCDFWRARYGS